MGAFDLKFSISTKTESIWFGFEAVVVQGGGGARVNERERASEQEHAHARERVNATHQF